MTINEITKTYFKGLLGLGILENFSQFTKLPRILRPWKQQNIMVRHKTLLLDGFKFHHLLIVWPWADYLVPLSLSIFNLYSEIRWDHAAAAATAAAASLQSCLTQCDPIDGSPPGFSVPGIFQARTLEWVAISFSILDIWPWWNHWTFLSLNIMRFIRLPVLEVLCVQSRHFIITLLL